MRIYTQEEIDEGYVEARKLMRITEGEERGFYAPLARRHPVTINDNIPVKLRELMEEQQTCAATDHSHVFIDLRLAKKMIEQSEAICDNKLHREYFNGCQGSRAIQALLAHEYTHILMRHDIQSAYFIKTKNPTDAQYSAWVLAQEIEANRAFNMPEDTSIYGIGATEESYPCVKGIKGIYNIYEKLYEEFGEDIDNAIQQGLEMITGEDGEEGKESKQQGKGKGKQASKQKKQGGVAGTTTSVASQASQDGQQGGSEGENGKPTESGKETASEGNEVANGNQAQEGKITKLNQRQLQAILNKAGDLAKARSAGIQTLEQLESVEAESGEEAADGQYDGTPLAGSVAGPKDSLYQEMLELSGKSPCEVAGDDYKEWDAQCIEKEFKKLRGMVAGKTTKTVERTYSRPSRQDCVEVFKKGVKKGFEAAPTMLVAVDKSGSMSSTTMKQAVSSVGKMIEQLGRPTKGCYICQHDSKCSRPMPLKKWRECLASYRPDGGNNFNNVLDQACKLGVQVVLNVGDGLDELTEVGTIAKAKKMGIKWYDVIITPETSAAESLKSCYEYEARHVSQPLQREPIFLGKNTH